MLNPSQGHFTLPHSLYIIYIYRYFLLIVRLPKREANCSLSIRCVQNQTMFEYIVSGYYHWFSLGIREDECWNINNSTHFLVTKSWHIIFSLLYAWVDPELVDQPNQAVSKPTSLTRTATWKWDAGCWILTSDSICLSSLTSAFCVFFYISDRIIRPLVDGWFFREMYSFFLDTVNNCLWPYFIISFKDIPCPNLSLFINL